MKLQDILTTYWSQVTLVLVVIGYFIQRIYELRLKKEETRHSLFQQSKINAITKFLSCYAKVEQLFQHIPHINIIQEKYTAKEIDEMIWPQLNELQSSQNELALFIDRNDLILFEEITNSIVQLNTTLQEFYFKPKKENTISMSNEFHSLRNTTFKENKNRISEIGTILRKMFNS